MRFGVQFLRMSLGLPSNVVETKQFWGLEQINIDDTGDKGTKAED
ncbi:hypothetical protein [Moorena sp. SIO1F2]|nr:hypothetical protein [Moorena sp. SIO1F2]